MLDTPLADPTPPLAKLLSHVGAGDRLAASDWLGRIAVGDVAASSNVEAQELPFQRWYRFKEAFSPRFVCQAIGSLDRRPSVCVDPFGGSGTTALTCQFLGIQPGTIEVNPFLADLIEAKLATYDIRSLAEDYGRVLKSAKSSPVRVAELLRGAPPTFVEPGVDDRWLFDKAVVKRLLALRSGIELLEDSPNKRLLRVQLGSIAVSMSNVVISGKGRRYRSNWQEREVAPSSVDSAFQSAVEQAIGDVGRFGRRGTNSYTLMRGDARELASELPEAQFALFSPPYPNSFDYTDIYNVELWLLGYLSSSDENRTLRNSTLRSHVQVKRSYEGDVPNSRKLRRTMKALKGVGGELWNVDIPSMVEAYFVDMARVLQGLAATMSRKCDVMMVVGDSRYAGVKVDVASICAEIAPGLGFEVVSERPIRAMRASAQQGGDHLLSETLLHLRR